MAKTKKKKVPPGNPSGEKAKRKTKAPSFPKQKLEEIKTISKNAKPHITVQGNGYLYFSIQPTQEDISLKSIAKEKNVSCYSVLNFKGTVIGYVVLLKKKPLLLNIEEFGAAIFYTKADIYKKAKIIFSDQKFRVIAFDSNDIFVSVKWKSNNPSE